MSHRAFNQWSCVSRLASRPALPRQAVGAGELVTATAASQSMAGAEGRDAATGSDGGVPRGRRRHRDRRGRWRRRRRGPDGAVRRDLRERHRRRATARRTDVRLHAWRHAALLRRPAEPGGARRVRLRLADLRRNEQFGEWGRAPSARQRRSLHTPRRGLRLRRRDGSRLRVYARRDARVLLGARGYLGRRRLSGWFGDVRRPRRARNGAVHGRDHAVDELRRSRHDCDGAPIRAAAASSGPRAPATRGRPAPRASASVAPALRRARRSPGVRLRRAVLPAADRCDGIDYQCTGRPVRAVCASSARCAPATPGRRNAGRRVRDGAQTCAASGTGSDWGATHGAGGARRRTTAASTTTATARRGLRRHADVPGRCDRPAGTAVSYPRSGSASRATRGGSADRRAALERPMVTGTADRRDRSFTPTIVGDYVIEVSGVDISGRTSPVASVSALRTVCASGHLERQR